MAETVILATNFDCGIIKYTNPKAGGSGGKSVNILNRKTNTRLNISTPVMLTWGASDYVDPNTGKGNGKFEMSLQFPTEEYNNPDAAAFLENMKKFEQKIKDDALIHSKEWFGKLHKSADVVDALYTPMLKYSKDKSTGEPDLNKAPSIRVKIPIWEGVWKCELYDDDGAKIFPNNNGSTPVDLIPKATQVSVLMTCGGIWFANGKFGITWKLVQAMVQKPRAQLVGQCFIPIQSKAPLIDRERSPSPEQQYQLQQQTIVPVQVPVLELASAVAVDDSDCDEEEDHSLVNNTQKIVSECEFGVESVEETTIQVATTEPKKPRKVVKKKPSLNEV
jgi:hypothetical protein